MKYRAVSLRQLRFLLRVVLLVFKTAVSEKDIKHAVTPILRRVHHVL